MRTGTKEPRDRHGARGRESDTHYASIRRRNAAGSVSFLFAQSAWLLGRVCVPPLFFIHCGDLRGRVCSTPIATARRRKEFRIANRGKRRGQAVPPCATRPSPMATIITAADKVVWQHHSRGRGDAVLSRRRVHDSVRRSANHSLRSRGSVTSLANSAHTAARCKHSRT